MHRRISTRFAAAALAVLPLLAACGDRAGTPASPVDRPIDLPRNAVAALRCTASVARASVTCDPLALTPTANGFRASAHVLGGQGTYVRLASSGVAYNTGTSVFSFNMTVQNLSTLALGTADGSTRHASGVQVFFASAPTATAGEGEITVANATGQGTFTSTGQDYFQYGGAVGGVDQGELGADGILATAEVSASKPWQLSMPLSVTTFSFTLYVATETQPGTLASAAPQVTSVSPSPLVPGATATLTGINFNATPGSNTVSIGGRAASVTGGDATSLQVTVPCTASGNVAVNVTANGMRGADRTHPLQVAQRTLGVGEAVVLTSSSESQCNELAATGTAARYVVTVFSVNASPSSNAPFQFSADGDAPAAAAPAAVRAPEQLAPARLSLDDAMEAARQKVADERHYDLLEKNRAAYELGRAQFPRGRAPRGMRLNRDVVYGDPPSTRQFRVSNISPPAGQTICSSFYVVNATRVYFNGKLAIYEDDATPAGLRFSDNASMAAYYQQIGDQFNADMEPIIRNNFGDILRRDAETDNNGIEIALFTPRINNSFSGVAGFVVSCDQFPNNDTTTAPRAAGGPYTGLDASGATASFGASNFGEYFYAYQPTINGTGFGTVGTPDYWYRTIRSTFIHESKHVASMAARVANNAPAFEASWLEEGTARHSEELWMRNAVDNVAWKGNTGYGSAANPINLYCDARPTTAACNANTRRPAVIMQRHFSTLANYLVGQNGRFYSPFGPSPNDTQSLFYAFSWSLVRYSIDRYGASDAAFLTALTNSTTSGVTNLSGRAGVSIGQLVGGWGLSLYADDYPGLAAPSADIQLPTWNTRDIYAGLNADFPATYTSPFLLVPTPLSFGSVAPLASTTMRGGGTRYFEFSGTQTAAQLLRLEASGGGTLPTDLRLAVARLQ
ncbi:IPT/TIG domain-containing protein [Longimicrobium sp.]|uniref:IPT/TIG domain-containing protein n=1 Tax=Longimicrobium sp. TaxID=2029185 RepID=UPI002D13D1C1|nr:IPT/TIG domain-containing protein [Longimicrobium sp.]HSU15119.1 IPT/TIG domain-containing protein [Longimicrobium sp.]